MGGARDAVDWETTQRILRDLIEAHSRAGRVGQIVVVGGTAMLAHQIRVSSGDLDAYSPVFDLDIVQDVEERYQKILGDGFRIDATSTENIWGSILIRDIGQDSPVLGHIESSTGQWTIRAMSIETLFLVKMEAGRAKDLEDLPAIAQKTNMEAVANRFVQLASWHGIPDALTGYADRFISKAQELWGAYPEETLSRIANGLPKRVRSMIQDAWIEERIDQTK